MSFSGGVYTLPGPALVTGEVVLATENNQFRNDVAGAFNLTMLRNGTSTATANLPMGGYKLTGLGAPSTNGDSLAYGAAAVVSTLGATGDVTLSGGTANGVAYLNGSKVLTTGSALTFDGTTLTSGTHTIASGNLTFIGTGNRITGDFSNATPANRVAFQTSTANGNTVISALPNGTSGIARFICYGNSDPTNTHNISIDARAGETSLRSETTGSGTLQPLSFIVGGSERMRIDTSGNVGIGTSSPSQKLDVSGNIKAGGGWLLGYRGAGGFAALGTAQNTASGGCIVVRDDSSSYNTSGMEFYAGAVERMRIDSSGNLLVGTTSANGVGSTFAQTASTALWVGNTNLTTAGMASFRYNGTQVGYISTSATNTTFGTSSDYRLKENIQPMQNALAVVQQLNPVTYTWKADGSDGQGFIAHELQAVVPDCVTGEKDAVDEEGNPVYQGIDTSFLVATLCKAIQEQQEQINQLKAEVAALKGN